MRCPNCRERILSRASHVIFVSRQNLKTAERQLAKAIAGAVVLGNPVNLTDLSVVPWPATKTPSLANVARLEARYKGQDVLFETLNASEWQSRDWRLRLYGDGPDRKYLEALAEYYGIANRIEFMGQVKDIRAVWSENHILVLPSRAEGTLSRWLRLCCVAVPPLSQM